MVTGLLLVAFTFFVFARAAVLRGGGQSAADAAALAATQEARDDLYERFLDAIGEDADEDADLEDILAGEDLPPACGPSASRLASRNAAGVDDCGLAQGGTGYTVRVRTTETVGDTVIPGTEAQHGFAGATAVLEGLCEVTTEESDRVELECEEEDWSFDPADDEDLPEARDLFRVYLED
ncbi:hypothetical protein [Streptomyces sp. MP131-18]|uniref:hypothetical protein n=1 Tax=Streptomyces sp. MP131-18 TaxID=1857892 RepID=UPI00097C8DED|nr:hypothetical protein [Streptomyces sp. MP131-18]ONK11794.1 hypothetical protein STBA_25300 [Streptomyces sp. MP131-18]